MSFSYPQQPMPPYGGQGMPGAAPPQSQQPDWASGPPPVFHPAPQQPPAAQQPPPVEKGDTEGLALLTVFIIFHILLNIYWLRADNHLVHLDEAHHINRAIAYYEALFPLDSSGVFARGVAALGVESPYPPLTHLVGAVFIRAFGYSTEAVAASGSLFLALFLVGVYLFARQGMTARNAFLAAFAAGSMPMVYGSSRYFMPELLLAALVTWALYALLKSNRFRNTGWVALFAFFTGLALLTKQTAPVYLFLPLLLILTWSCWSVVYPAKGPGTPPRRARAAHLLFNALLCACIVLGVCSWWYTRHVEYMYTWWSTQRGSETGLFQPSVASRIEFAMPEALDASAVRIYLDPAISRPAEASETPSVTDSGAKEMTLLEPFHLHGDVYPIHFVNEVAFLPLALVALLGLPVLVLRRNRNAMTLTMLAWAAGSYLLLTGVFALRGPLLLCATAAPGALLCVMALDAISRYRLRRALWGLMMFLFALQYVNLTLFPYGPVSRLEIPALNDHPAVTDYGNRGLTLYKDRVDLGSYTLHSPERGEVITEAIYETMLDYENKREELDGPVAWYQVLSETPAHLSMDFYALHYRPTPNPLQPDSSAKPELAPRRPFAAVKWESRTPDALLPELAETAYVVMKQDLNGPYIEGLETWALFLKSHGFESIFNRSFNGYGKAAPGYVHVMARKETPIPGDNAADIFALYDLLDRDGKHWLLSDEEREEAERRYARLVEEYTRVQALTEQVNLLGLHVKSGAENWHVLRLIVQATEPLAENLTIWLRATVHPEDQEHLLQAHEEKETLVWDFAPKPETTNWQPNQALVLSRPIMAAPLRYQLEIGLAEAEKKERPKGIVETEWVDFSETR